MSRRYVLRLIKDPELQEKLKSVKTPEELLALAKAEGYELSEEQMAAISSGEAWYEDTCKTHRNCDWYWFR